MTHVVDVPFNTAIADLDDVLRAMLERELARHGFEGVEVACDAPSREWSGKLTHPTVNLFLYELREAADRAELTPTEVRENGVARIVAPPLRLECSYAVTAWTQAVQDEHRLLSQVIAILVAHRRLPGELLAEHPAGGRLRDAETAVGRPREGKADFWTSVGGQYKPSVDLSVQLAIESGAAVVRGPQVRMQTLRAALSERPVATVSELHRLGGVVLDRDGEPAAEAWVALPETGRWTVSDRDGHFVFDRVQAGEHEVLVLTTRGAEARRVVELPGTPVELVVGERPRARTAGRGGGRRR
jgi:hypothetical protein